MASEFTELYRLFHEARQSKERTEREVDGLIKALDLREDERVLDLACGWGVHLAELSRRGYGSLVGVDFQEDYLAQAARRLESTVKLLRQDARELDFSNDFDACYCLYNTLFAWDDATHLKILRGVARALRPGGRFLFDTTNRERVAKQNASQSWQRPDADLPWLLREARFDVHTGDQHHTEHTIFSDGRVETRMFKRRHYTVKALTGLFQEVGLRVTNYFGSLGLEPYTLDSPRTILVAEKETENDRDQVD